MSILPDFNDTTLGIQSNLTDYVLSATCVANTPQTLTVPTDQDGKLARYVLFGKPEGATSDFFAQAFSANDSVDRTVNGTFTVGTGWTLGAGWTIGTGVATASGAISTAISQVAAATAPLVSGQTYVVTFTTTRSAGSLAVTLGGGTAGTAVSTATTTSQIITAGATQTIAFTGSGFTGSLDNVSILLCANVPSNNTTGQASVQNPIGFYLARNASTVSIVSGTTPIITAAFYK